MNTYIVGHTNPDTDSIVSAIALADFLNDGSIPAKAGSLNNETVHVLNRFSIETPVDLPKNADAIILVDHNSPDEASELVTSGKIKAVYDHHRLGGAFTADPVPVRIEPVGSACTVVAEMFNEADRKPSNDLAAALICGILSDTLNFTSPTATDQDKKIVEWLNGFAGINLNSTAEAMFLAKSDISGVKTAELLTKDFKIFEMSGQKVGIGVWETVIPDAVMERKTEILAALKEEKVKLKLDYIYFAVIDILKQNAYFFIDTEKETAVAEAVFKGTVQDNMMLVEGVVSRKKQIVPPLEKYFS